mmetsp:Transcript_99746/g.321594  ORF Transcript_99746/g.321594 Transcript_99746/m.321594 type:complete len:227 (-) Transcript_99746:591-1271(-)
MPRREVLHVVALPHLLPAGRQEARADPLVLADLPEEVLEGHHVGVLRPHLPRVLRRRGRDPGGRPVGGVGADLVLDSHVVGGARGRLGRPVPPPRGRGRGARREGHGGLRLQQLAVRRHGRLLDLGEEAHHRLLRYGPAHVLVQVGEDAVELLLHQPLGLVVLLLPAEGEQPRHERGHARDAREAVQPRGLGGAAQPQDAQEPVRAACGELVLRVGDLQDVGVRQQ